MADENNDRTRKESSDLVKKAESGLLETQSAVTQLLREYKIGDALLSSSRIGDCFDMIRSYINNCSREINTKYPPVITGKDALPKETSLTP